jgi:hypothetical protein
MDRYQRVPFQEENWNDIRNGIDTHGFCMTVKAFTIANEANDNINHDNQHERTSTRMFTSLLDQNEAFLQPTDISSPYFPNLEVSYHV